MKGSDSIGDGNWITDNLNSALSLWNDKLSEIWELLTTAPDEAARGADVLFTDVWTSMGMERETERRRRDFNGFCLDAARMALAKPDCIVQHPLPAHRGEEITPDVFETHADEIFDEAENRLHVEKAVLGILLAGK